KMTSKSIFHDTRGDIRQIVELLNDTTRKLDEVIEKVNELDRRTKK
ncbi:MAG: hypothetical protein K0S61_669, partial [Anaerocolumna sp.]|nr:hypothetical protein [Anaerocolumna sp.]